MYNTAGIVCYTVHDDTLYLLLGREQYTAGWLCSHQWSEPGGHAKRIDQKNVQKTAIREFTEETLDVLPEITQRLQEKQYTACLQIYKRKKRAKAYYLVHLPTRNNELEVEFHIRREQLRGIQNTLHRLSIIQKNLKQAGAPAPECLRRVYDRLQVIQDIVAYQELDDNKFRVLVRAVCSPDDVYFRFPRGDSKIVSDVYMDISPEVAPLYVRLLNLKHLLQKQLVTLPLFLRVNAIQEPVSPVWLPKVRREFLEKDRLRWLPAHEILQQLDTGKLRPGFEPSVQLLIMHLANVVNHDPPHSGSSVQKSPNAIENASSNTDAAFRSHIDCRTRGISI
jgi:hypothetical protein